MSGAVLHFRTLTNKHYVTSHVCVLSIRGTEIAIISTVVAVVALFSRASLLLKSNLLPVTDDVAAAQ